MPDSPINSSQLVSLSIDSGSVQVDQLELGNSYPTYWSSIAQVARAILSLGEWSYAGNSPDPVSQVIVFVTKRDHLLEIKGAPVGDFKVNPAGCKEGLYYSFTREE